MTLIFVIAAAFGNDVDWNFGLKDVAKVAASGVAVFVAFGVAFGVMDSVMVGLTLGVASGVSRFVAVSVTFGVVGGVTFGVVGGIAGVAGVLGSVAENVAAAMVGGVAFGVITSVMSGAVRVMGVALGVINGVNFGVELGVAVGLIASVAWGLGAMRLPFYLFEILPAVLASTDAARAAGRLSVNYGARRSTRRLPILPQPFLAALLLPVLRADLRSGLWCLGEVASNPFQRWAARRALRRFLEQDGIPFFVILDRLLAVPAPYVQSGIGPVEDDRAGDRYFTTRPSLAELMERLAQSRRADMAE